MLRALSVLVLGLAATATTQGVEQRTPVYFLADELAAADGLADTTRGTVGTESAYVVRNTSAHVATRPLRVPAGAELRLQLGVDGSASGDGRRARFSVRARRPSGESATVMTRAVLAEGPAWVETRIPLEPIRERLGSDLRLVFKARAEGGAVPLWGDPTVVAAPGGSLRRPPFNVVLVSIDTLRADRLGCYGGPATRVLDRIASEGALFEVATGAAPSTRPSHATMMTGVYPCVHHLGVAPGDELPAGLPTLAQMLRAHGWVTAAITEGGYLDTAFARGFGTYRVDAAGTLEQPAGRVEDVVADARGWLAPHADEPFFLFVHTYQPHFPYTPPAPYRSPPAPTDRRIAHNPTVPPAEYQAYDPDLYDGEVRYTDDALEPLFAAIRGLGRETLVVVTSDHGEAFGEHGHFLHGEELYEEDLLVPFLWWDPVRIPPGRRISRLVTGPVDIVPTVLDLAGIERPAWLNGRSLAHALREDPPTAVGENMVYSELAAPAGGVHRVAVRGADWKSIFLYPWVRDSPMTLLTLSTDPGERHPTDISRERAVSWTTYLADECARGVAASTREAAGERLGASPRR
jgi:arylsulfatase A-like enzyme